MIGEDRLKKIVGRGKYGPLYRCLLARGGRQWRVSFVDIEAVLGFELPESARMHRPWWSNQRKRRGYGHALAWQLAGWKTVAVDLAAESLVFERAGTPSEALLDDEVPTGTHGGEVDLDEAFPPYNPGPWPVRLSLRREDLYDERGR